jgi:hypothetical protein
MNHHHPVSEAATLIRAAKHLIQNHGAGAAGVAAKRATFLEQCGEVVGADTWHKIAGFVRAIETKGEDGALSAARAAKAIPAPPAAPTKPADPKRTALMFEWPRRREQAAIDAGIMALPPEGGLVGETGNGERAG